MKVAFFQPYIAAWRFHFLERYISVSNHEVIVYDGGFTPKKDEKSITGNASHIQVTRLWSFSSVLKYKGQDYPFFFSPLLLFKLIQDRPRVIVTEGEINFINNFFVWVYCRLFGASYIWWSLGKVRTRRKNLVNKIFDPFVNFLLRQADAVLARNTYAAEYYSECKGIAKQLIFVAPNSMDEERARAEVDETLHALEAKKSGRKIVLYVGALTKAKRPNDLVEMLRLLRQWGRKDIAVWFVGDGPLRGELEANCVKEISEGYCRYWGKQFSGVGNFFRACDLVVVPGLGGLVINHAMIFGKPVISRVADGTEQDLIHPGQNGFILDSYSVSELAESVLRVIDSPDYAKMCAHSLDVVDTSWNMRLMIKGVDRAIDCVCGNRRMGAAVGNDSCDKQ